MCQEPGDDVEKAVPSSFVGGSGSFELMLHDKIHSCIGIMEGAVESRRRRCSSSALRMASCKAGSIIGMTVRRTTVGLALCGDASAASPPLALGLPRSARAP